MPPQTAANSPAGRITGPSQSVLAPWKPGVWRVTLPGAGSDILAGVTDRSGSMAALQQALPASTRFVTAEQVHGAGIAGVELAEAPGFPVAGCDALATQRPGTAVVIRTADCLPIGVWDPVQRVAALAHAGWRGLREGMPRRLIRFLSLRYHSDPKHLLAFIGPSIRACCYDVGGDFDPFFSPWTTTVRGRPMCDLTACASDQLAAAGVVRVVDAGVCTACDPERWHSVRRAAPADQAARLFSFILIHPDAS